jgi:hypothetical protein
VKGRPLIAEEAWPISSSSNPVFSFVGAAEAVVPQRAVTPFPLG